MNGEGNAETRGEAEIRFAILRTVLGDDIAAADQAVSAAAGFSVANADDAPFVRCIEWINTSPSFIAAWRSDPESERIHYLRFMAGLDASRTAYAAAAYHLSRLREIESEVHEILEGFDFSKSVPKNSTVAIGSMRKCDFEYHAFIMAYRRALDGLAWGLSTYLKAQQSSFRSLARDLVKYHPPAVGIALDAVVKKHFSKFDFVMADERGKSTRDRIAHKEAIQSGCINLMASGHFVLGGGENLGFREFPEVPRLSAILERRLSELQISIREILEVFQCSVDEFEKHQI